MQYVAVVGQPTFIWPLCHQPPPLPPAAAAASVFSGVREKELCGERKTKKKTQWKLPCVQQCSAFSSKIVFINFKLDYLALNMVRRCVSSKFCARHEHDFQMCIIVFCTVVAVCCVHVPNVCSSIWPGWPLRLNALSNIYKYGIPYTNNTQSNKYYCISAPYMTVLCSYILFSRIRLHFELFRRHKYFNKRGTDTRTHCAQYLI